MDKTLSFAIEMEKSITANMERLQCLCSPRLEELVTRLLRCQEQFEALLEQVRATQDCTLSEETGSKRMLGDDAEWTMLCGKFKPDEEPQTQDFTVLWSFHSLLDKSSQFYQQASRQDPQVQLRLFFSNIAELKTVLRRRVDGVERIIANQVWAKIGFAPGLLGKD